MSHLVSHVVTDAVSHMRPDQTRPDQTSLKVVCGVSGSTSIDLTVGLDSPPEAWMETDDLNLLDEGQRHGRCPKCYPVGLFQPFTALCGTRAMYTYRGAPRSTRCDDCRRFVGTTCTKCGSILGSRA